MSIVEIRDDKGKFLELMEITISRSGMLIWVTDNNCNQVSIHRQGWQSLVNEINRMLQEDGREIENVS